MIIKGNARSDAGFWAKHLMRADHNEAVRITDISGLSGQDARACLMELDAIAEGTNTKNGFYVASLNPREDEKLTGEQWDKAAGIFLTTMGLENQPYFIVEHEKDGRTHRHIIAGRIDADTMKAIPADFNYQKHEGASREIEQELGLAPGESVLVKDREAERPERRPKDWEGFRAADTKIDPQAMKVELTALWQSADSGQSFKAALEDAGYILARGDRRDFVIVDQASDDHSLARRISGAKAADIRERMGDIDRAALPSVAEARDQARVAAADSSGSAAPQEAQPEPQTTMPTPAEMPAAITDHAGDLAARFGDATAPGERPATHSDQGQQAGERPEDAAAGETGAREEVGAEPERKGFWGHAWRVFADRAASYADELYAMLKDESSGTPPMERTWLERVARAGVKTVEGVRHHDGIAAAEGLTEAAKLAKEKLDEIAADEEGGGRSWTSYVKAGMSELGKLIRSKDGSGVGLGISNPEQSAIDRMAEEYAQFGQEQEELQEGDQAQPETPEEYRSEPGPQQEPQQEQDGPDME